MAVLLLSVQFISSCERLDNDKDKHIVNSSPEYIELVEVAEILSLLPVSKSQLSEVHDAVCSSSDNGYDEEYTMADLFASPGSGVGDRHSKSGEIYENPMRDLIGNLVRDLSSEKLTRSDVDGMNVVQTIERLGPEGFLASLSSSDMQIYWPFSENWDGTQMPVITYDPEDGSENNIGYRLLIDDNGFRRVEEVIVDEEMAKECAVWVVNRNDDAMYTSLEMLRREDPNWGEGGGAIVVKPDKSKGLTKTEEPAFRSLLLKDFTMKRNYDTWFAGASEFFVKIGSVEDFTATTEAELRLYTPSVTDFMIVVKRHQLGIPQPFNAVLVSEISEQLTHCALMIIEDDGGTVTSWDCKAFVRIASKSYGVEVSLPFKSRDDIVWRGQLALGWFENNNKVSGHFGDVDLTFEILEY